MNVQFSQDIQYLKGVGPTRAKLLRSEMKISTLRDLIYTFPTKYIDRSTIHHINELSAEMPFVQLKGTITIFLEEGSGRHSRLKAIFTDGTGYVELIWFAGLKYIKDHYKANTQYLLFGKPTQFGNRISFSHPELEKVENGTRFTPSPLRPHYSLPEKVKKVNISNRVFSQMVFDALELIPKGSVHETLPAYLINELHLITLGDALRTIHFPQDAFSISPAQQRLKFEELFYLQLDILRQSRQRKQVKQGFVFNRLKDHFMSYFHHHLPFSLTGAQQRVLKEIYKDMGSGRQMNRLLQGDVGSGKTIVALMCCLIAIDNGFQACIMAPTEILAEQHYATFQKQLAALSVKSALLTGKVKGKARKEVLSGIADGSIQILIGTHALIEPNVTFQNLGFCVIDEQHRFGVRQRSLMWQKNRISPHILVMTATPIPRTLAMTVYGDLDVSVIDELPPGRKPIQTLHRTEDDISTVLRGMEQQILAGRQAYIIYPLIQESEKIDLKNLEDGYEELCERFPQYNIGKVHGKMKPQEKDEEMQRFLRRETQILVSTTVIEVGVNVPNATTMIIRNAERFGLAQLHQLRGRVGRGDEQSYCILITKNKLSEDTLRRMNIMVESTDGFLIAEEDLKLRGPGDLSGTTQSGIPFELKAANLIKDVDLMQKARATAERVLDQDPQENLPQNQILWQQLAFLKPAQTDFSDIS